MREYTQALMMKNQAAVEFFVIQSAMIIPRKCNNQIMSHKKLVITDLCYCHTKRLSCHQTGQALFCRTPGKWGKDMKNILLSLQMTFCSPCHTKRTRHWAGEKRRTTMKVPHLTSLAWEKWLKRFSGSHTIYHFHVAMMIHQLGDFCIPFIIATWKWWILKFSPNLFSHVSYAELLRIKYSTFSPVQPQKYV